MDHNHHTTMKNEVERKPDCAYGALKAHRVEIKSIINH